MSVKPEPIESLTRTPASDFKKKGWRGIAQSVAREGRVLITNHNRPEAVILSVEHYQAMTRALNEMESRREAELKELRRRFDQRLEALKADDAGERLRDVLRKPATLDREIKAGEGH